MRYLTGELVGGKRETRGASGSRRQERCARLASARPVQRHDADVAAAAAARDAVPPSEVDAGPCAEGTRRVIRNASLEFEQREQVCIIGAEFHTARLAKACDWHVGHQCSNLRFNIDLLGFILFTSALVVIG
jgi:hypothetical protein